MAVGRPRRPPRDEGPGVWSGLGAGNPLLERTDRLPDGRRFSRGTPVPAEEAI